MSDIRDAIREFLASQTLGVVSTVNGKGDPESALVAFSETPELSIVFGTSNMSRKFANITANPHVSFVIATDEREVQFEGVAHETKDEELNFSRALHLAKNPSSKKYADRDDQRFFIVTPTWLRNTDYSTDPDTIEEVHF